jgi:phenylalanine-4-hydroxylase
MERVGSLCCALFGLRIYGSRRLSSPGAPRYCLDAARPRRLRFDLRRITRTRYRIDDFQQLYFVIDAFQELFEATRPDFAPIYREIAALPDLEPTARLDQDREFAPHRPKARREKNWAAKKIGPRISAAQV